GRVDEDDVPSRRLAQRPPTDQAPTPRRVAEGAAASRPLGAVSAREGLEVARGGDERGPLDDLVDRPEAALVGARGRAVEPDLVLRDVGAREVVVAVGELDIEAVADALPVDAPDREAGLVTEEPQVV